MSDKPKKVIVIASGPIVIGQAGLLRLVDDFATALDLPQETQMVSPFILFQGEGQRFEGGTAVPMSPCQKFNGAAMPQTLEVVRYDSDVDVTPLAWASPSIGAKQDNLVHPDRLEVIHKLADYGFDVSFCRNHEKASSVFWRYL